MAHPLPAYDVDEGDAENPFGESGYDAPAYDEPAVMPPSAAASRPAAATSPAAATRPVAAPKTTPSATRRQSGPPPTRRNNNEPLASTCWSKAWWRQNNPFVRVDELLPAKRAQWYKYMMYISLLQIPLCFAAIANCARGYQWGHLYNLFVVAFPFCHILAWGIFFALGCIVLCFVNLTAMIVGSIDECPGEAVSTSLILMASNILLFYCTINYDPKVIPTIKYFLTYLCVCCGCKKPPHNPPRAP